MTIDYKKLKFKSGLEIHQQLDTHKLYCECPSVFRSDEPEYEVTRKLHAVAGESGEVDIAAAHQAAQDKEFIYQAYDTTCLVELDEEPPHKINPEALKIAMQISLLFNCKIVPIAQIMRKTVIDGSNTSGFQRTVLIGMDGYIKTSKGKVGIDYVYLEEDAARIVEKEDEIVKYRLDRLGIPLVEIVTAPDVEDAEHAKEVALQIGEVLRSCKVRRGIGTIRQDVNISIMNENRVEIKGMQDMDIFVKAIENEVLRQKRLHDESNSTQMEVRNVLPDATTKFMRPMPGSARMYPETDLPLLKISRDMINEAKKDLPKLRSELEIEMRRQGLTQEMIKSIFKLDLFGEYKELHETYGHPTLVAKILVNVPKDIAAKKNLNLESVRELLNIDVLSNILNLVRNKELKESDVKDVLNKIADGVNFSEAIKIEKVDESDVEERIMKIIRDKPALSPNAYMGLVMKEFKGAVDGKTAMKIINKFSK